MAVLRRLDDPDDAESWPLLRDVLDVVRTTPEFLKDLESRFERFLDEALDQARDALDDEDDDLSDMVPSIDELEDLATRWGVSTSDIDEIAEQANARQDNRPPRPHIDQQQLLATPRGSAAPANSKSIFNYL